MKATSKITDSLQKQPPSSQLSKLTKDSCVKPRF